MKYTPKLPQENINVGGEGNWKAIAGLLVVGFSSIVFLIVIIYFMAEKIVPHVPIAYEEKFKSFSKMSRPRIYHKEASIVLQKKIEEIIEKSNLYPFPFEVYVIDSKVKNAGIMPGGIILFYSELIRSFQSENELIFVLGHELGHFYKRHHLKSLGTALGATLLSTILSSQLDIFSEIIGTSSTFTLQSFSRTNELQSDEFGLSILNDYYGHVKGYNGFFEMIEKEAKGSDKYLQFLQTHPASSRRLERLTELVEKNHFKTQGELVSIQSYLDLLDSDNSAK